MLNKKSLNISILLLSLYSLGYYFFGERIPIYNGFGWDGTIYAAYVQSFWGVLRHTNDIYHINRILPSFIIYCFLKLLHLNNKSPVIVVDAFIVFNSILFILSAYLWFKICDYKKFVTSTYWLGFISLFVNYLYLKHNFYDSVLTDTAAIFLGMLSLYFYVQKRYVLLAITMMLAFFTWPISVVLLTPLLLYTSPITIDYPIKRSEYIWSLLFTLAFIGVCIFLTYILGNTKIVQNSVDIYYHLLPLSILLAAFFIYVVLLHSRLFCSLNNLFKINLRNSCYLAISLIICMTIYAWLKHHLPHYATDKSFFTITDLLSVCILGAIAKPGLFFISHLAFLGPVVILIIFYLKDMMRESLHDSFGLMLFMIGTAVLALNSQTRQIDFNYPYIIYLVCLVMDKKVITPRSLILYLIASFIISKVYYLINVEPLTGSILTFPFQRFMMNSGTYMNWGGYFVNLGLFLLAIIFVRPGLLNSANSHQSLKNAH
jgi:hypothetical protein